MIFKLLWINWYGILNALQTKIDNFVLIVAGLQNSSSQNPSTRECLSKNPSSSKSLPVNKWRTTCTTKYTPWKNGCLFFNHHRSKLTNWGQIDIASSITPQSWMNIPKMNAMCIIWIGLTLLPISEVCLFSWGRIDPFVSLIDVIYSNKDVLIAMDTTKVRKYKIICF